MKLYHIIFSDKDGSTHVVDYYGTQKMFAAYVIELKALGCHNFINRSSL